MKKIFKLVSLLTIPLSLVSCKNKNNNTPVDNVSRIEAYYILDNSEEESKETYTITYGNNFQDLDVRVYAYNSRNERSLVEFKTTTNPDGYTYQFTEGDEDEYHSLKPSVGTYTAVFSYEGKQASLSFVVNPTSERPENFSVYIQDFEYNETSNAEPQLRNFPEGEEITSLVYEYALYDNEDKLGEYLPFDIDKAIAPGRYNLKVTVNSKNYKDIVATTDFTISKMAFPEEKFDVSFLELYSFQYEFGKTNLGNYSIPSTDVKYYEKGHPEKVISDDKVELVWAQPLRAIPVFGEETSIPAYFRSTYYKDYKVEISVKFETLGIVPPYNIGFTDEEGNFTSSVPYDGQPHEITYETGLPEDSELPYHIVVEESKLSATKAGTYKVVFALNEPESSTWYDETGSNENKEYFWTIEQIPLVPNYTSEYKIQLGDQEFEMNEDFGHLDVVGPDEILPKRFKLMTFDEDTEEFEEYPVVFENIYYKCSHCEQIVEKDENGACPNCADIEEEYELTGVLNIEENLLKEKPENYFESYYVKVTSKSNYKFEAVLELVFYPSLNKDFVFDEENPFVEEERGKVSISSLYNESEIYTDQIDTNEHSFLGIYNNGAFALSYQYEEDNLLTKLNSASLTFSLVNSSVSSISCYVLTLDEYSRRVKHYSTVDDLFRSGKPLEDDIQVSMTFNSGNKFVANKEYVFDFSELAEEFLEDEKYIVCFYIEGGSSTKPITELSELKLNCVRSSYLLEEDSEII